MTLKDGLVRALLVACRETRENEIGCEEFLATVAAYAEGRVEGRELAEAVAAHERLCAYCLEECRALVELIEAENPGS